MKGASKVIMAATLVMIVSCAILLILVLIILAELFCSRWLHCRLRKPRLSPSPSSSSSAIPISAAATSGQHSLSAFYSQGVIKAPRSLLFPSVEMQKQQHSSHSGLFDLCESSTDEEEEIDIEIELASLPPCYSRRCLFTLQSSPPMAHLPPPKLVYEVSGSSRKETCVYISNPVYDGFERSERAEETPFETPDSSPSRLESGGSSSPECGTANDTPPLAPMKKLPGEGVSVALRDGGSLAASGSESNSNNEGISSCLSTGTPCTSSSW